MNPNDNREGAKVQKRESHRDYRRGMWAGWFIRKALGRGPKGQSECAHPLERDAVIGGNRIFHWTSAKPEIKPCTYHSLAEQFWPSYLTSVPFPHL